MEMSSWPPWLCPKHRSILVDRDRSLVCPDQCCYFYKNGIPRFVPNAAYTSAFGLQWNRFKLTQLDSHTGLPISKERLRRCLGEEVWTTLDGKLVLEAGCGAGRFTEILIGRGARVTSIDLSEAVEANQDNFPQNQTHRIAQADILHMPFAPQQFDLVVCLGVIQHTPNPEETIAALYEQVKPGGLLVFDHYAYSLSYFTKTAPLFRAVLRRVPADVGMTCTEWLVKKFLPLHQKARSFYPAQMLISRLSPVLCYYHVFPELGDELQAEWALLDTHDSLTDWYKHFRTRGQIRGALGQIGATRIWCDYSGNGVEARGFRSL